MKTVVAGMVAGLVLLGGVVMAEEGGEAPVADKPKAEKPVKEQPPMVDLNLSGKVVKTEKPGEGDKPAKVSYYLETADGQKISLPVPKAKKGEDGQMQAAINLDDYVDSEVTVTATGTESMKGEKKQVKIKTLSSIQKAGAPAAE